MPGPLEIDTEWVQSCVADCARLAHDPETAHTIEDSLHASVLMAVAAGHRDGQALAAAALKTREIPFSRWRA
jgi:hypothetical protein